MGHCMRAVVWLSLFAVLAGGNAVADEPLLETTPLVSPPTHSESLSGRKPQIRVMAAPYRVYSHPAGVLSVAFHPSGQIVAAGDAKGKVWLWPVGTEGGYQSLDAHRKGVTAIAFNPEGTEMATGGRDGLVRIWNLKTMEPESWLDKSHRGPVTAVAFIAGGSLIASASKDDSILVRNVITGRRQVAYFGHSAAVTGLAVSPEALCAISGGHDESLQSWNLETGEQVDFSTQRAKVTAVALSRDGRLLASATSDGTIEIRRTDGCGVHTVALRFTSSHRTVRTLVFSENGKYLYSAGEDHRIATWNLETGFQVASFVGHEAPVTDIALSPGDAWLASGGLDKTVRLWRRSDTAPAARKKVSSTIRTIDEIPQ